MRLSRFRIILSSMRCNSWTRRSEVIGTACSAPQRSLAWNVTEGESGRNDRTSVDLNRMCHERCLH